MNLVWRFIILVFTRQYPFLKSNHSSVYGKLDCIIGIICYPAKICLQCLKADFDVEHSSRRYSVKLVVNVLELMLALSDSKGIFEDFEQRI